MWHNETRHVTCLWHTDIMWCCDVYIMSCDILVLIISILAMYSRLNGWILSFWTTDSISRRNTFQCKMCIVISIHQPIYVSIYPSICLSIHLSIHPPNQQSIFVCLSMSIHPHEAYIYPSIYLSIPQTMHLSINPSTDPSPYPVNRQTIRGISFLTSSH